MGINSRRFQLLATLSVLFGLGLATAYGGFLAYLLYRFYGPVPGRCGTAEVGALAGGAVVVAPIAILLVVAIVRFRTRISAQRVWRAVSWLAVVLLLVTAGTNWVVLFRIIA